MPLRQQRHLEVRALGLCAFERGAQLGALGLCDAIAFFLLCTLPLEVTVVTWGSIFCVSYLGGRVRYGLTYV